MSSHRLNPATEPTETPSGRASVRAVTPEADRQGYCGTYRAWMLESFCAQYRRHKSTYTNGPSHLNMGCRGCDGLDFGGEQ
jgi:hypothetical protein